MISYIGGKARIGKWITPFIPTDIETYVEGFSGMFWVFFNMDLSKYPNLKTVVYNDFNGLNANLMKCSLKYDILWDELSKYPCQQLGVVDTPPEYAEMFNKIIEANPVKIQKQNNGNSQYEGEELEEDATSIEHLCHTVKTL